VPRGTHIMFASSSVSLEKVGLRGFQCRRTKFTTVRILGSEIKVERRIVL
jgi:hypothetical protein